MQKDDLVYVGHMLDTAPMIVGKSPASACGIRCRRKPAYWPSTHLIQTFGEAARRVSPEFQQAPPPNALEQDHWYAAQGGTRLLACRLRHRVDRGNRKHATVVGELQKIVPPDSTGHNHMTSATSFRKYTSRNP